MPIVSPVNQDNWLLTSLPPKERERILKASTQVELTFGNTLWEQGERMRHVYFPNSGFISLLITVDGHTLEVGMIGNEGMCGHSLALGADLAPLRALVQGAGTSLRLKASSFRQILETSPALRQLLLGYTHVLMSQLTQTAACTRFHTVETRLARWLLMTQDRAHADTFDVTQDFLAFMLGVRRVGITAAARTLQAQKLIRYARGHVSVLDRSGLEAAACACYQSDLDIYRRVLGARKKLHK
ncbi:MAG: Crp/Fnr family transcriptional regulator [Xanthomonadales bacterium]|nr:Crp/Fnr family transcriptional regulator [Xanthomonadales bacterium]